MILIVFRDDENNEFAINPEDISYITKFSESRSKINFKYNNGISVSLNFNKLIKFFNVNKI